MYISQKPVKSLSVLKSCLLKNFGACLFEAFCLPSLNSLGGQQSSGSLNISYASGSADTLSWIKDPEEAN
jgi:hypothetical protein